MDFFVSSVGRNVLFATRGYQNLKSDGALAAACISAMSVLITTPVYALKVRGDV
jgi:hypothetical protein